MKNNVRNTAEVKEGELYVLLWLLDYQGIVYFDKETDTDIINLENHLNKTNIKFKKGKSNRMYLSLLT